MYVDNLLNDLVALDNGRITTDAMESLIQKMHEVHGDSLEDLFKNSENTFSNATIAYLANKCIVSSETALLCGKGNVMETFAEADSMCVAQAIADLREFIDLLTADEYDGDGKHYQSTFRTMRAVYGFNLDKVMRINPGRYSHNLVMWLVLNGTDPIIALNCLANGQDELLKEMCGHYIFGSTQLLQML